MKLLCAEAGGMFINLFARAGLPERDVLISVPAVACSQRPALNLQTFH